MPSDELGMIALVVVVGLVGVYCLLRAGFDDLRRSCRQRLLDHPRSKSTSNYAKHIVLSENASLLGHVMLTEMEHGIQPEVSNTKKSV